MSSVIRMREYCIYNKGNRRGCGSPEEMFEGLNGSSTKQDTQHSDQVDLSYFAPQPTGSRNSRYDPKLTIIAALFVCIDHLAYDPPIHSSPKWCIHDSMRVAGWQRTNAMLEC